MDDELTAGREPARDETGASRAPTGTSRRAILAAGVGTVMAGALAACGDGAEGSNTDSSDGTPAQGGVSLEDSMLTRIMKDRKIRFGVDLSFKPTQYRDPQTNEPTGSSIEVVKLLAEVLGAEPEWVEIPFAELFAAQEAGRFDMVGSAAGNTPERASKVAFAFAPAFLESNYLFQSADLGAGSIDDLNDSAVKIATVVGTTQATTAGLNFPEAEVKQLPDAESALLDVTTGRANVLFVGDNGIADALDKELKLVSPDPVDVAWNTYFMPLGDAPMHQFVTTFIQNKTADLTIAKLYHQFVGSGLEKYGISGAPVRDPYLAATRST